MSQIISEKSRNFPIKQCRLVSVEHPFIVRNASKGVESLGGASRVAELVDPDKSLAEAELSLRPDDLMAGTIGSGNMNTDNLLIEIKVPRLTGRKRKRGSNLPYTHTDQDTSSSFQQSTRARSESSSNDLSDGNNSSTKCLLNRMANSPDHVEISVIGSIERTHRFRVMPDFVFSTAKQKFMQGARHSLMTMRYDDAKNFRLEPHRGVRRPTELVPPPQLSHLTIPFNYMYHQNPAVRQTVNQSGEVIAINDQMARKIWTERLDFDCKEVPSGPEEGVPPVESLGDSMKKVVEELMGLMKERPIWTRRAIANQLENRDWINLVKHVYQYLGYTFRSGPWRDAIIKYGVDPRTDPKYRIYQTMVFQLDDETPSERLAKASQRGGHRVARQGRIKNDNGLGRLSHTFDGTKVGFDGKIWQVCDITDPLLSSILSTTELRKRCHIATDGWYHNGTWAKARVIAKTKMMALKKYGIPKRDTDFSNIINMPDNLDGTTRKDAYVPKGASTADVEMAANVRGLCGTPDRDITLPVDKYDKVPHQTPTTDIQTIVSVPGYDDESDSAESMWAENDNGVGYEDVEEDEDDEME